MAAVSRVGKIGLKTKLFARQAFKVVPVMQRRYLSDKTVSQEASDETNKPKPSEPSYQVPEYYAHNKDTYADLEIEMSSLRQSQPDPRVPYHHNYPWEKK